MGVGGGDGEGSFWKDLVGTQCPLVIKLIMLCTIGRKPHTQNPTHSTLLGHTICRACLLFESSDVKDLAKNTV